MTRGTSSESELRRPTVGFIGLGVMGAPMSRNLIDGGFDVIGFSRRPSSVEALVSRGGRAASSVAGAVAEADIVATMLPDAPDVAAVVCGPDGVLDAARPGALVIDFSTISPAAAREVAASVTGRGLHFLDAPVSGGEAGAVAGTLSIMAGGAEADFKRAQPVFSAVGAAAVHVGPAGAGQIVKAANQLIVAGAIELIAEAIVFLEAQQIDAGPALAVIGAGLAGSTLLDRKGESMLARDFTPGFRAELHHKDLGIVTSAARAAGVAIPMGSLAAQLMGSAVARGDGHLDHTVLLSLAEQLAGRADRSHG